MGPFRFGQVVLLKFPFTDGRSFKRRPAMVVRDTEDWDVIVCRINSKIHSSDFDLPVKDWEAVGLKLPSVIRLHKLASLETALIERIFGELTPAVKRSDIGKLNKVLTD